MITEQQYQRLMNEYQKGGEVGKAAMKAGMHRQTARRYLAAALGPNALRGAHTWRTREDPLEGIWPLAERWLTESPEVEFKALFEHLVSTHPGEVDGRALRTFQRRAADWLRRHGPPKEVFFAQKHEPGECLQSDWTNANELKVTIGGEAFAHLLCHCVLPYSNWEWASPCLSESGLSLKSGLQAALWELGGVPRVSQTDQSSTATHQLKRGKKARGFNTEYLASVRTSGAGASHHRGGLPQSERRRRSGSGPPSSTSTGRPRCDGGLRRSRPRSRRGRAPG